MPLLTAEDKTFFKDNGYLIKRNVLSQKVIDDALDRVWEKIEEDQIGDPPARRDDPKTWHGKGYRVLPIGGEEVMRRIVYEDPVFEIAEELVGKDKLRQSGGPSPYVNFPNPGNEWRPPSRGHLDGYHTPTNGVPKGTVGQFTLALTAYIDHVPPQGGGTTVWPGSHKIWAEYFRYHDIDSLPGGIAPFDLGKGVEFHGGPGDVCFWHNQMTHGSGHNASEQIRIAMITRLSRKDFGEIRNDFPDDMWKYWDGID